MPTNVPSFLHIQAQDIIRLSPLIRILINDNYKFEHPVNPMINGVSHIMWTGKTIHPDSDGRNAVFYGDKAIDRSPCGTGTSARMAQWVALGKLKIYSPELVTGCWG